MLEVQIKDVSLSPTKILGLQVTIKIREKGMKTPQATTISTENKKKWLRNCAFN
jgi:hypothetical protein